MKSRIVMTLPNGDVQELITDWDKVREGKGSKVQFLPKMDDEISQLLKDDSNIMSKLHYDPIILEIPLTYEQEQDLEYFRQQVSKQLLTASTTGVPNNDI